MPPERPSPLRSIMRHRGDDPGAAIAFAPRARAILALGAILSFLSPASGQAPDRVTQPTPFASMAPGDTLGPWEPVRLGIGKHPTRYALIRDGDAVVLHAVADSAASGVAHPVTIDVRQTPLLAWRWKVERQMPDADVAVASRDDSPARILLGFDGDRARLTAVERVQHAIWGRIIGREPPYATLAYVWSNDLPVGAVRDSPHSRRIRLVAASTGVSSVVGAWQALVRDVHADFRRAFGEAPGTLTSVTVVTDTDDTQSRVEAWYGDIRFEAARAPAAPPGAEAATAGAPAALPPGASGR